MSEILVTGCQIKVLRWEQDLFILTGGMRDSFKIDGGMQDEKQKITCCGHYGENRYDQEEHSERGGMAGLSQK